MKIFVLVFNYDYENQVIQFATCGPHVGHDVIFCGSLNNFILLTLFGLDCGNFLIPVLLNLYNAAHQKI